VRCVSCTHVEQVCFRPPWVKPPGWRSGTLQHQEAVGEGQARVKHTEHRRSDRSPVPLMIMTGRPPGIKADYRPPSSCRNPEYAPVPAPIGVVPHSMGSHLQLITIGVSNFPKTLSAQTKTSVIQGSIDPIRNILINVLSHNFRRSWWVGCGSRTWLCRARPHRGAPTSPTWLLRSTGT
jgi:hypothetical protein